MWHYLETLGNLPRFFAKHPLTKEDRLRAFGRVIAWQVRSRLEAEVIFDWVEGQKLVIRRGMTGATGNIYTGLHEFVDMMFLLHYLREGDCFLDIGANVGSYTVLAAGARRATTWAFEPDPIAAKHLRRNISVNNLEDRVHVFECALGATRKDVAFTISLDTQNKIVPTATANTRIVTQEPLDALIGSFRPGMIKIDVEGGEEGVLQGAPSVLAEPALKVIAVETVTEGSLRLLNVNGFHPAFYDPFKNTLNREPVGFEVSNALFVRDWSFVADRVQHAAKVKIFNRLI